MESGAHGEALRAAPAPRALPGASRDDQGVPTRTSPHFLRSSGCRAGPGRVTSPRSPPTPSRREGYGVPGQPCAPPRPAPPGPERSPGARPLLPRPLPDPAHSRRRRDALRCSLGACVALACPPPPAALGSLSRAGGRRASPAEGARAPPHLVEQPRASGKPALMNRSTFINSIPYANEHLHQPGNWLVSDRFLLSKHSL